MTDQQLMDTHNLMASKLSDDELHIIRLVAENTRLQKELAVTKTCMAGLAVELGEVMEKLEELRKLL